MQTTTTLTGVKDTKSGTSARGAWTLTIFAAADGREYSTLKGDVASAAQALIGQLVTIEYSERQNGKFTNYSLEAVSAAGEGAVASPVAAPANAGTGGGKSGEFRSPAQIIRQGASEVAVAAFAALGLNPVEDLVGYLEFASVVEKYVTEGIEEEPEA